MVYLIGTTGDVGGALRGLDDKIIVRDQVASMGLQLSGTRGILGNSEAGGVAAVKRTRTS